MQGVDWQKWFYGCGLPEMPAIHSVLAEKAGLKWADGLYPALHGLRQVDLLVASLKGGYDGSKEDMEGWFPKQTEHLGEV